MSARNPNQPPQDETPWSDEEQALFRQAVPSVPSSLASRVLDAVREAALRRLRFRQELERSARMSLIAAAAGLLACAVLVLNDGGSSSSAALSPTVAAFQRPSATQEPSAPSGLAPIGSASEVEVDDTQALSFSSPPGVLETELTSDLWLFSEEEGE